MNGRSTMSSGREEGPVYYREIQKNAYLKRVPNDIGGSKLRPLGHKKPVLKPMWTLFCVHNGRTPFLEQYPDAQSPATMAHAPSWRACLRTARHVTASVKPHHGIEYDFLIDTDQGPVRMRAPDWDSMHDWVTTLRTKLHELKILSKGENVYCAPPAPPAPRAAARDPTSPLPPTPPVPPDRVPGIELTTVRPTPEPQTESQPEPQSESTQPEPIDISSWDTYTPQPSTSNKLVSNSVTKICGQNICLDDSILKRNVTTDSDEEFFAEIDRVHDSVEDLFEEEFKQRVVVDGKAGSSNSVDSVQSERQATNITVIQVSNRPPHTAIPVMGSETDIFDFTFKQKLSVNPETENTNSNSFINIVNTESERTENGYGTVFGDTKDDDYGHLSLTTTVSLTGDLTDVKTDNEGIYERLCLASTSNSQNCRPSPLPVRKLKNLDKNRKSSLPNLDVATDSTYEYLFPNFSQNNNRNINTTNIMLNSSTECNSVPNSRTEINSNDARMNSVDTSRSAGVNNEVSRNAGINNDTSRNAVVNNEVSRNACVNNDTSRNAGVNNEVSRNACVNNDTSRNAGANNDTSRNAVVNNEVSRNASTNNDTSRNAGANNDTSRNAGVNNDTSRNAGVNNEVSRNASINNDTSRNAGANNDTSRNAVVNNEVSRNASTNNDTSRNAGVNNEVIRNAVVNNEVSISNERNDTQNIRPIVHVNVSNSISVGMDLNARVIRSNVERSHSQNAYDSSPRMREQLIRRIQNNSPKREVKNDKSEPQPKPIWKRGLTELSLLSRLRGVGQRRQESPTRLENEAHDRGVTSPAKVVHRSRPEGRIDGTRRRSSSLSNGQSPPSIPSLQPLRARQAAALRAEQRRGAAVAAALAAGDQLLFCDYNRQVWIACWGGSAARCGGRPGDRLVALRGTTPRDAAHARQLAKGYGVDILFHRVPLGKMYVLNKRDLESIGIKLDGECNISSLEGGGAAARAALPPPGRWAVTEVNNRPLNLLKGGEEEMNRLSLHGTEVSVLIQPSPLVKKIRAAVKGNKPLLSIR